MMHHFDTASIVLAMAEDYDRLAEHASGNAPVTRTIAHCRGASPHGV
jgi:hypothetical protein